MWVAISRRQAPTRFDILRPRYLGERPLDDSSMLWVPQNMNAAFPLNSLNARQTVIVGELLREHPKGRIENENGKPVFISAPDASALRIPLSETNRGSMCNEPQGDRDLAR